MYNLRHKRDKFLLVDRAGVLSFTTQAGAIRYLKKHMLVGQYDVTPAAKLGSLAPLI